MSRRFKKIKRNKKLMIILAVFLMSLTLGYSLLAATKSINGHSLFANSKWDIHWDSDSVEVLEGSVNTDTPYVSDNERLLSYSAELKIPGDYYEFTVDAVNAGTIDGMLNIESALPIVKTSTGEVIELPSYLKYTITYADGTEIEKNHLLAKRLDETHPTREKYKIKLEFDPETDTLPDKEISIEIENDVPYDQADDEAREREHKTLKKYTVTFDPKGGTVEPTTKEVEENGRYGTLPVPVKTGYTFLGWYLNDTKITSKSEVKITSNITLEAKYQVNEYKITYTLHGGVNNENNPNGYNADTNTITLADPIKTGYIFLGWTGSNGTTPQKNVQIPKGSIGDKNYEANWEQGSYTITYNLNGGENSGLNPSSYTIDSNDITLQDPTRTGYKFLGWTTTGLDTPTKNIKITKGSTGNRIYEANWEIITYKIIYTLNNGTDNHNNPTTYTVETDTITLADPTREGYNFLGWTGSNGETPEKNVQIPKGSTGDKNYTSNWTKDEYIITYNLDGGTNHSTNPATYKIDTDTITLQNPTKTGYTFTGWTGSNGTTPTKNVQIPKGSTGNKEYTANWEIITYQIKYVMDSGTNNPNNPTTYTVETETITLQNPTRTGYTFQGWTTPSTTTPEKNLTIPKGSTENKTFYAHWQLNTYSITYTMNNGINHEDNPASYTIESNNITLRNPTKTLIFHGNVNGTGATITNNDKTAHQIFAGWTGSNGNSPQKNVIIPKGSTGNKIYTAHWTAVAGTLPIIKKNGYDCGWSTSNTATTKEYDSAATFPTSAITEDMQTTVNLYAVCTRNTYTITYNLDGGTNNGNNPASYDVETATITLQDPTKTGYTFTGWTGEGITTPTKNLTIPKGSTGNKTYTANWSKDTYTITYNLYGGTNNENNPSGYDVETSTITLQDPTKTGYTFTGWTGEGITTPTKNITIPKGSTGNKTYTANWSKDTYTISYTLNGGTNHSNNPSSYQVDTATITLGYPTREGYTFTGWTGSNGTTPQKIVTIPKGSTGNKSYTANWTTDAYTITYNLDGGTNNSNNPSSYNVTTNTITLGDPEKEGYTFLGWTGNGTIVPTKNLTLPKGSTGNKTFTANWSANTYTITYSLNNGVNHEDNPSSYTPDTNNITLGQATKTLVFVPHTNSTSGANASSGQVTLGSNTTAIQEFAGWTGSNGSTAQTSVTIPKGSTGDKSYTAHWTAVAGTLPTVNRTGYTCGWNTSNSGTTIQYGSGGTFPTSAITESMSTTINLYAVCTIDTYTITYNLDGGTNDSRNPSTYTIETNTITLKNPKKSGYTFTGWTGEGITTPMENITIPEGTTGDKTFTANWKRNNAEFDKGFNVNGKMKQLAGTADATEQTINTNITAIVRISTAPDINSMTDDNIVSSSYSGYVIYMWYSNGTIYWWCEDNTVYLNSTSGSMFSNLQGLTTIDASQFNTKNAQSMYYMFRGCKSLTDLDLSSWNTTKVNDMSYMFSGCESLTNLNISSFNTSDVESMSRMFEDCKSLTTLNLSNFNTSKVTTMDAMFSNCYNLTNLNVSSFNTSNVTDMQTMFDECKSLTTLNLSNFNTSKVTTMRYMFNECRNIINLNISSFDTGNVTDMEEMFSSCNSITSLDLSNFNTSKVTTMRSMFSGCESLTNLNISSFNTNQVTDMHGMFYRCFNLPSLDLSNFNTSKVTSMSQMFYNCDSLVSLDLSNFNTSKVTSMFQMFYNCHLLTVLDLSSFNTNNATNMTNMFASCEKLKTIYASDNFITTNVTDSGYMFSTNRALVGSNGTEYSTINPSDKTYARIDTADTPGYFTAMQNKYKIKFKANGGIVDITFKVINRNETIGTLPTPTRSGYGFLGWYTDLTAGTKVTSSYIPSGNITLYAHWTDVMAENLSYTPPSGSGITCTDAQCMIEKLDEMLQ